MPTRYSDGEHQIIHAWLVSGRGLQDLKGKEHQIVHAYEVSRMSCIISRVRNNSYNMHTRYQDGAAGSQG